MYFYPNRESSKDLNAELVWVHAGSKDYYLDPAMHYYGFGVLPWFEEGADGVRVSKDGSALITTPSSASTAAAITRHADVTVSNAMEMTGKLQIDFSGETAGARRYENRNEDASGRKKVFADEIKTWLPVGSTFEVTDIANWDDVEQPIEVTGALMIPSFVTGAVTRMLMPLDPFQTTEMGYFQSQKRANEVDFGRAYQTNDDLLIHPPTGYKVQALPAPQKIDLGAVAYHISATQVQDTIEVQRSLVINGVRYPKESYAGLRSFFSAARTFDDAQILLQSALSAKNN
jgi:hypothetical protein